MYETVAGANPKVARSVDTQSGPYPWAMAQVVALDGEDQANTSLAALADENYPIDQLNQDGDRVQQLSPTRLLVDGALRGSRVAYQIASQQTGAISFEQVAFLNLSLIHIFGPPPPGPVNADDCCCQTVPSLDAHNCGRSTWPPPVDSP